MEIGDINEGKADVIEGRFSGYGNCVTAALSQAECGGLLAIACQFHRATSVSDNGAHDVQADACVGGRGDAACDVGDRELFGDFSQDGGGENGK